MELELLDEFDELFELELLDEFDELFELELLDELDELLELELLDELDELFELELPEEFDELFELEFPEELDELFELELREELDALFELDSRAARDPPSSSPPDARSTTDPKSRAMFPSASPSDMDAAGAGAPNIAAAANSPATLACFLIVFSLLNAPRLPGPAMTTRGRPTYSDESVSGGFASRVSAAGCGGACSGGGRSR